MMPPVVIIAGGTATRLRPITETIPKAMLEAHILENAAASELDLPAEALQAVDALFAPAVRMLDPGHIQADDRGLENFIPGVADLAAALEQGEPLKPIRVVPGATSYTLVEGKLRYWAWVQAFGPKCAIPSLVRGEEGV